MRYYSWGHCHRQSSSHPYWEIDIDYAGVVSAVTYRTMMMSFVVGEGGKKVEGCCLGIGSNGGLDNDDEGMVDLFCGGIPEPVPLPLLGV